MKEELHITSTWDIVGLTPEPTIKGLALTKGEPEMHTLEITVNAEGVRVFMFDYYEQRAHIEDCVDRMATLYQQEIALRDALLQQVDFRDAPPERVDLSYTDPSIGPLGWDVGQWRPYCNEEGISWHLWMNPSGSQSLVLSIYLDVDLDPDIESRTYCTARDIKEIIESTGRYITLEARGSYSNKPGVKLFSYKVLDGQIITHKVLRDALAEDPLGLSALNSYCSEEV